MAEHAAYRQEECRKCEGSGTLFNDLADCLDTDHCPEYTPCGACWGTGVVES